MWSQVLLTSRRRLFSLNAVALPYIVRYRTFTETSRTTIPAVSPTISAKSAQKVAASIFGALGVGFIYWGMTDGFAKSDSQTTFTNWSQTHEVSPMSIYFLEIFSQFLLRRVLTPESEKEIETIVSEYNSTGNKLRVVGSGLSPNGIGFSNQTMLDMALMDKILEIDPNKKQIRVQCGARVEAVVEAIRPHGLTLENYASIKEQQIGGFVQIGAHGTGCKIPPVDEQVVRLRIVTPGKGTLELSKDDPDPTFFHLVRVGLGCFGIVTEVTLQCVADHKLIEKSFVATFADVKKHHTKWLKENRHLRYMWIPCTDCVVVVQCNLLSSTWRHDTDQLYHDSTENTRAMRDLIATKAIDGRIGDVSLKQLEEMSSTQLRDMAYEVAPMDFEWVKKVNEAEAEYWKKACGTRVGWSHEILGFDCGGQQWVLEVAFPMGTFSKPTTSDLDFIEDIMNLIEKNRIPAHSPIEHRWSSSSSSQLSPVHGISKDDLHSWIGVIHYLPTDDAKMRQEITECFSKYARRVEMLLPKYNGTWHWGKLEVDRIDRDFLNKRLTEKFPMSFVKQRLKEFDPNQILENRITSVIFSL